jgi:Flavodoxin domain
MKGTIVYDSYYGNTKMVAQAIAEQLRAEGDEADLRSVRERQKTPPDGDILFLGSPVRMGSVTGRVKKYVKKLDETEWKDRPVVVFTTILALPEDATDAQRHSHDAYDIGAGLKLGELARSRGLRAIEDPLWVEVRGMKGPLVETGVEKTKRFTHELLASL